MSMPYRRSCGVTDSPRAVLFDFNGTISDDEPVLARIFARMFAEIGIEVSEALYFAQFAGYSDPEIVERVLDRFEAHGDGVAERLIARRSELYFEEIALASPIRPRSARFVREVAARVPVAIASGAAGAEIEAVLAGAELRELFDVIVAAEDVTRGQARSRRLRARPGAGQRRAAPAGGRGRRAGVRGLGDGARVRPGRGHALCGCRGHHPPGSTRRCRCDSVRPGLVYTNGRRVE